MPLSEGWLLQPWSPPCLWTIPPVFLSFSLAPWPSLRSQSKQVTDWWMSLYSCTLGEEWLLQQDRPSWEGTWKLGNKDSDSPALPHLQHNSLVLLISASQSQGATVLSERSEPVRTDTLIIFNFLHFPGKSSPLRQHRKARTDVSHLNALLTGLCTGAGVALALSSAYHRAWYPLTCLWMVMAAFLIRMYFFLISQPRIVFWMRIQAALNLSALIFSR